MDLLLVFFFLIIASVFGISIGLILGIKSYLKLAFISVCIFITLELSKDLFTNKKKNKPSPNSNANTLAKLVPSTSGLEINNTTQPTITSQLSSDNYPLKDDANNRFAREKDLEDTKYGIFKHKDNNNFEMDKPPFDGLEPKELMSRLNYIYFATANPLKPINYTDFKMHADKYLDEDGTKLSSNEPKLLASSRGFYPQLTADQIDAKDCLNYGSDPSKSCFQSAQLFYNIEKVKNLSNNINNTNLLSQGVNVDNANLIIREDFSNPEILNPDYRFEPTLFVNSPIGNLDRALDQESNESIKLINNGAPLCRHCKLAVCENDYCGLQNELFM